jgi:hypothetical protein
MSPMFMIVCCAQHKQWRIGGISSSTVILARGFGIICKYPGEMVQLLRVLCSLLRREFARPFFLRL